MPHMSGDMAGGGMADEYADYEVQVAQLEVQVDGEADGGPTTGDIDLIEQTEPVSDRGIDSDELAELVAFRTMLDTRIFSDNVEDQNQLGSVEYEADVGINLQNAELPSQSANNNTTAELQTFGNGEATLINYSEPGVLDTFRYVEQAGFDDTTNGSGGPGATSAVTPRHINYRDLLGTGPFVDRTDDLTLSVEVSKSNVLSAAQGKLTFIGYWDVHEMPEGRASFARP